MASRFVVQREIFRGVMLGGGGYGTRKKFSTTDPSKSKTCDPIIRDSPLLSSHNIFHHKNYSKITHNIHSIYWPNGKLAKSLLHISIHENHLDHRITLDSPLLSTHNSFQHKNYSDISHNILPNYRPNENLVQSFLHNLIHENHHQLILTSPHHKSPETHLIKNLPRQKINSLSLKSLYKQKRIFSSPETEKYIDSSSH